VTIIMPEGVPILGNTAVTAVVAIADMTAPSLATEVNAATSVDISLFLSASGWNPQATSNKGTRPARLGQKTQREAFNRTTFQMGTLSYTFDPQAPDTDDENKAKALLLEGTTIFLVERLGLDAETDAWAVGQQVRCHKVILGVQSVGGDRTDENGEFVLMQDAIYAALEGPVDGTIAA
jgi:hypothetical protein